VISGIVPVAIPGCRRGVAGGLAAGLAGLSLALLRGGHALARRHQLLLETAGALEVGVGEARGEEADRADGVLVAGDREVDELGVAVGVDDGDHRDAELVGLGDGDRLLLRIDDEERVRQLLHLADAAQVLLHLAALALEAEEVLLGQPGLRVAQLALDLLEPLDRAAQGDEVGQRAAKPAVGDVELAAAARLLGDHLLRLPLGADEQQALALRRHVGDVLRGLAEQAHRALQVDDVDPVALAEDETLHLRVPAPGLVAEVDAGLQQVLHAHVDGHVPLLTAC
jgi:hypothetical protein